MASRLAQRTFLWTALAALVALAALAVVGAFLGAREARELFTSLPLRIVWIGLAVLLLAGFGVFLTLRRKLGLAAMHLGTVMVLVGSLVGSPEAHELWGSKIARGLVIVGPTMDQLRTPVADGFINIIGELPYAISATAYREEYHPPQDGPWDVKFEIHLNGVTYQALLEPTPNIPQPIPYTDMVFEVRHVTPELFTRRNDGSVELAETFALELIFRRGDMEYDLPTITTSDGRDTFWCSLEPFYPNSAAWAEAGTPLLEISAPALPRKQRHVDLAILDGAGEMTTGTLSINKPFWHAGYLFYFNAIDTESGRVMLTLVSDSGWAMTWAGMMILLAGTAWYGWAGLVVRRRAS